MANPVTELIGADGYLNLKKFFKHPLVKQVVNINLNLPISVLRWLSCALNLSCEMSHDSTDLIFFNSVKIWQPIFVDFCVFFTTWNCSANSVIQVKNNFMFVICTKHVLKSSKNQSPNFSLIEETMDLSF